MSHFAGKFIELQKRNKYGYGAVTRFAVYEYINHFYRPWYATHVPTMASCSMLRVLFI